MSRTNIVIFKLPELFKILNEIKKYISINFELLEDLEGIKKLSDNDFNNSIVITDLKNELKNEKNQIVISKFPTTINYLVEKINILSLKNKYYEQSEILINNYTLDLNSRLIKSNREILKLTEKEIQIILFLKNSKNPQDIQTLQKEVWGHNSDLETHTVETHIYRLRKKIAEKFKDQKFINSTKLGYQIL